MPDTPATAADILARVLGTARYADLAPAPIPENPRMTREQQAQFNRTRALKWHTEHTPAQYRDAVADLPPVLAWAQRMIADPATAGSLLLLGGTGVGKTHQSYGAMRLIAASGRPPLRRVAISEPRLYANLRNFSGRDDGDPACRTETYIEADLLLLDDIGSAKDTDWTVAEVMFPIIDARYSAGRPTILTSNLDVVRLAAALGDRVSSRLEGMCEVVDMDGTDRRQGAA